MSTLSLVDPDPLNCFDIKRVRYSNHGPDLAFRRPKSMGCSAKKLRARKPQILTVLYQIMQMKEVSIGSTFNGAR